MKIDAIVKDGGVVMSSMTGRTRVTFEMSGTQSDQAMQLMNYRDNNNAIKLNISGNKGTKIENLSAGIWKIRTVQGGGITFTLELDKGRNDDVAKFMKSAVALENLVVEVLEDDKYESFTRNKSRTTTWETKKRAIPN